MPKNPAAHTVIGYRGPYDGTPYIEGDRRLKGMGNPPSDPAYQRANPGRGRLPMQKQAVPVDELPEEVRPSEGRWVLKPIDDRRGVPIELDGEPEPEPET